MGTRLVTRTRVSRQPSTSRLPLPVANQLKTRTLSPAQGIRNGDNLLGLSPNGEAIASLQARLEKSASLSFDFGKIALTPPPPPTDAPNSHHPLQLQETNHFPPEKSAKLSDNQILFTSGLVSGNTYLNNLPIAKKPQGISSTGDFRIQGIFGAIKKAVSKGIDWVKNKIVEPIKKATRSLLDGLKNQAKKLINGLKNTAKRLAGEAKRKILSFINKIKQSVNRLIQRAKRMATQLLNKIKKRAQQAANRFAKIAKKILQAAQKQAQKYSQKILQLAKKFVEIGNPKKAQDLIQKLNQFTDKIINKAKAKVQAVVGRATKFISQLLEKGMQGIRQSIQKVTNGVQKFVRQITGGVEKMLNGVTQAVEKVIQKTGQVNQLFQAAKNKLNSILGPARKVAGWLIDQMMNLANQVLQGVLLPLARQADQFMKGLLRPVIQGMTKMLQKGTQFINQGLQKIVQKINEGASWFLQRIKKLIEDLVKNIINKGLSLAVELVKKVISSIMQAIEKLILEPLKAFFEFLELITQILAKSASVIDKILGHPVNFIKGLFSGVKQGLSGFGSRILQHLEAGLKTFLFGPIASMGIELPQSFDLKGIFGMMAQLAGLSYGRIRERASSKIGDDKVTFLEEGAEATQEGNLSEFAASKLLGNTGEKPEDSSPVNPTNEASSKGSEGQQEEQKEKLNPLAEVMKLFGALRNGPGGIVDYFKELDFNSLITMVMDGIKEYLTEEIVQKAIIQISAYLIPGAGWLKAAIDALRVMYAVFIKRAQQVKEIVEGFTDSIADVAKNAVGQAAKRLEGVLGKSIPVLIGVLADYLGIGNLPAKIQGFLQKGQKWVDETIMPVIDKILDTVAKVFAKIPKFDLANVTKKVKQGGLSLFNTVKAGIRPLTQKSYSTLAQAQSAIDQAATGFTALGLKSLSLEPVKQQAGVYTVIARKPLETHNNLVSTQTLRQKPLVTIEAGVSKPRRGFDLMQIPLEYQGPSIQLAKSDKSVGKIKVEEEAKQRRVADLPSLKKVTIDWQHIYDGHWEGTPAQQRGNNTVFNGLSKEQIQRVVKGAYRQISQKLQTQGDRIKVRGEFDGWLVEFWVNKSTKMVETAYPIF